MPTYLWDHLLERLPDELKHWLACDCAARALERERERGREADAAFTAAIAIKRQVLAGMADATSLQGARKTISALIPHDDAAKHFANDGATNAATHAALICVAATLAEHAGLVAQHAIAHMLYAEDCAAKVYGASKERALQEQRWVLSRLRALETAWAMHGPDAPKHLQRAS